jgi:plasmid stabilization system protein ParE
MAKFEIKWNNNAEESLRQILEFYFIQNGSVEYSLKLHDEIIEGIDVLKKFPNAGKQINYKDIYELVFARNSVFYRIEQSTIFILLVWDNRQNPEKLSKYFN